MGATKRPDRHKAVRAKQGLNRVSHARRPYCWGVLAPVVGAEEPVVVAAPLPLVPAPAPVPVVPAPAPEAPAPAPAVPAAPVVELLPVAELLDVSVPVPVELVPLMFDGEVDVALLVLFWSSVTGLLAE